MKKHSLLWWLCIGWWWWLGFAWWVYPIKYLLLRKFSNASSDAYNDNYYQLMWETKESIIDFLKKSDGSTALQVEINKMFTEQIEKGQDYDVFKKCVSISILDFKLFKNEPDFYSCFHIREDTRNFIYTDKMEFHVIELPKLPKELKEGCSSLELWAKFISAERKEEFDMIAKKDVYIQSAYNKLQVISQDKQKRMEYEARQKALLDHNQFMLEATRRGMEKGRLEGRKEGEEKEKYKTAKKLIELDMATDFIIQVTGFSVEIIDGLRKQ